MKYLILLTLALFVSLSACTVDAQQAEMVKTSVNSPPGAQLDETINAEHYGWITLGNSTYPVYCTSKNTECTLEGSVFIIRKFCDEYKPDRHYLTKAEKKLIKVK
jgi:hypothetical protein